MFFFSFKLNGEARDLIMKQRGEHLIFGQTTQREQDGTPMCVILGSADTETEATEACERLTRIPHRGLERFFSYTKEQLLQGVELSDHEHKAGNN